MTKPCYRLVSAWDGWYYFVDLNSWVPREYYTIRRADFWGKSWVLEREGSS